MRRRLWAPKRHSSSACSSMAVRAPRISPASSACWTASEVARITLYDLVFEEDRRPTPFFWRAKLGSKKKGAAGPSEPVGFTEKQKIAFAQSQTVPVIHDDTKVVKDSWAIARHLDEAHPDKPLFKSEMALSYAHFAAGW